MPGIILSLVLIVGIAAGIAWPLFQRQRTASLNTGTDAPAPPAPRRLERLYPHCSSMNGSSHTACRECGSALSLDNLPGLLGGADKQETIIVGTLALLSFRLYKHVSGD